MTTSVLTRGEVKRPVLPKETVPVEALGGSVVVRGMYASERLELASLALKRDRDAAASAAADARVTAGDGDAAEADGEVDFGGTYVRIPRVLACVVLGADELPIFSEKEWQVFGGQHPDAVLALFTKAKQLSGMDVEEVRKNS